MKLLLIALSLSLLFACGPLTGPALEGYHAERAARGFQ